MKYQPRTGLYDLTLAELEAFLAERGVPKFRAKLAEELPLATYPAVREVSLVESEGETVKFLFETPDDRHVEAVLMFYPDRATACVSCQIGCPIRCTFCATGLGGLERNLTPGEMVAQVVALARRARAAGRPLTNVVMMGMGEPLANYEPTLKMIGILNEETGLAFGARRVTVSTAGIVPNIDR